MVKKLHKESGSLKLCEAGFFVVLPGKRHKLLAPNHHNGFHLFAGQPFFPGQLFGFGAAVKDYQICGSSWVYAVPVRLYLLNSVFLHRLGRLVTPVRNTNWRPASADFNTP